MTRQGIIIGIKFAIVFVIAFALLGYPAVLSVLLGLIAGGAGGVVGAWWTAKEDAGSEVTEDELLSPLARARRQLRDWRQNRQYKIRQKRARTVRRSRRRRSPSDVAATDTTTATPPSADVEINQ
jgi:hypothetical protein